MWFFYLLGVVIALIIDYIIAKKFADIAEMKGHEGDTYFWFTFIFGVIGMLMVVALPDTIQRYKPTTQAYQARKENMVNQNATSRPAATHTWRCDNCGKMATQSPCEHCGK